MLFCGQEDVIFASTKQSVTHNIFGKRHLYSLHGKTNRSFDRILGFGFLLGGILHHFGEVGG